MRLRQDGHGTLRVAGPAGVAAVLESVQPFISWLHPAVQVLEASPYDVPVIYKVCHSRSAPQVLCVTAV